jgi:hypothetical protein
VVSVSDGVFDVANELEKLTGVLEIEGKPVESIVVGFVVSVTGYTVVEVAIVEVLIWVESAGQLVTVGAQLVIVTSLVT